MPNKKAISLGRTRMKTHYSDSEACVYFRADDVIQFLRNAAVKSHGLSSQLNPDQGEQALAVAETLATFCETFNRVKQDVIQKRTNSN